MAAEPFFFSQQKNDDAQKVYARVMKFFVIACCFMFLLISLFIDAFGWFFIAINKPLWVEGLYIVPLLALGNIFLGIYYNLSIWYKLTNKNLYGAYITIGGAIITIALNIVLIPRLHYLGAAIATFVCYLFMMVISYLQGQRNYPVPYNVKKLLAYITVVILAYGIHRGIVQLYDAAWLNLLSAAMLFALFTRLVIWAEQRELQQLPVIGKWLR
jgi:O-antigen/teichoic acid export membrane protein